MKKALFIIILGMWVLLGCEPVDPPPPEPDTTIDIRDVKVRGYWTSPTDPSIREIEVQVYTETPYLDTGYVLIKFLKLDIPGFDTIPPEGWIWLTPPYILDSTSLFYLTNQIPNTFWFVILDDPLDHDSFARNGLRGHYCVAIEDDDSYKTLFISDTVGFGTVD